MLVNIVIRILLSMGWNWKQWKNKKLTFKNNVPSRSCTSKINNTFIENAEDIVMSMYNLLEYSFNYSKTSRSLRNYYRDKTNVDTTETNADNCRTNNNKVARSKSFEFKTIVKTSTLDVNTLDRKPYVALK